MAYY
jgi:hypothetical protein